MKLAELRERHSIKQNYSVACLHSDRKDVDNA